jgi:hypothetical protein
MTSMAESAGQAAWPRVTACVHCRVPVLHDNEGSPIHANLSYVCRDRWGQIMSTTATPPLPAHHQQG